MGFNNICEDTEFIAFVAIFAGEAALSSCQSIGQLFAWPEFEGLSNFLGELQSETFGKAAKD